MISFTENILHCVHRCLDACAVTSIRYEVDSETRAIVGLFQVVYRKIERSQDFGHAKFVSIIDWQKKQDIDLN